MSVPRIKFHSLNLTMILVASWTVAVVISACASEEEMPTPVSMDEKPASTSVPDASSGETIKIGTLLDSTGDLGIFGPPMIDAVDLAVELVNEAGGVNGMMLETIHRDSGTSEQLATDAASGLINVDGVNIIIGSISSGVTIAIAESVTIPSGKLLLSPASSSLAISTLDDDDLVFRTRVSDGVKGIVTARLAHELGYKNVATMYINNAYGESYTGVFADSFEEIGGAVSAQVGHESGQASYISELKKAADSGAEALVAIAYPESAAVFLRESVESGLFEDYVFVDVAKSQDLFDSVGGENFDGSYGTAPGAPNTDARIDFLDLYRTRTDGDPDSVLITEAFDAAVLLALAIEKADSDSPDAVKSVIREVANPPGEKVGPKDVARALELIRNGQDVDYVGAAGDQDIDENGDVLNTIEIWRIVDGKIASTGIFAKPGDAIDLEDGSSMQEQSSSADHETRSFTIGSGSQGLFKVGETLRGLDIVVALQTDALNGTIDLEDGNAQIEIDLHTLESDQDRRDRYVRERLFASQRVATVEFESLGEVPDSFFTSGEELKTTLTATVNVNGADADIDFDITARLDNGEDLVILGIANFTWSDFGMTAPVSGFYSVEDDIIAEILLRATLDQ